MPHLRYLWRVAASQDLPHILAISDAVHPSLPEQPEVFAERLALFAQGVHVLALEPPPTRLNQPDREAAAQAFETGAISDRPNEPFSGMSALEPAIVGYGICYPWILDHAPPLDTLFQALPDGADCLFIHDVALLPQARGQKAGQRFTASARGLAADHGLSHLALISVYESAPFWRAQGFETRTLPGGTAKLAAYGPTAQYMAATI